MLCFSALAHALGCASADNKVKVAFHPDKHTATVVDVTKGDDRDTGCSVCTVSPAVDGCHASGRAHRSCSCFWQLAADRLSTVEHQVWTSDKPPKAGTFPRYDMPACRMHTRGTSASRCDTHMGWHSPLGAVATTEGGSDTHAMISCGVCFGHTHFRSEGTRPGSSFLCKKVRIVLLVTAAH